MTKASISKWKIYTSSINGVFGPSWQGWKSLTPQTKTGQCSDMPIPLYQSMIYVSQMWIYELFKDMLWRTVINKDNSNSSKTADNYILHPSSPFCRGSQFFSWAFYSLRHLTNMFCLWIALYRFLWELDFIRDLITGLE